MFHNPRRFTTLCLVLVTLLLPQYCWAESEPWSDSSRFWAATSALALANDWMTTRDLTQRYQEGYYELNPILGQNPSTQRVDLHFLICIPAIYLYADYLPDEDRVKWLKIVTAVEAVVSGNNLRLGLRWRF
jgi:hypothetical protein